MLDTDRDASLRRFRTGAYYVGFWGLGLMDAVLGPTLPWLAGHASIAVESAGIFFAARSAGYMLGSLIAGRYYDRVPGHGVMAAGLAGAAATLALVPSFTGASTLVAAFALAGAGSGALDVGGNTLLAWMYGDGVGPFLNGLHFFFGLGSFLAPVFIAQAFARGVGLQWVYGTIASLAGLVAMLLVSLPSPAHRSAAASGLGAPPRNWTLVVLVAASLAAYVGLELGFGGWIFTYATDRRAMTPADAAYLTSVFWGSFMLGRLVSIPAMSYLARREERRLGQRRGASLCRVLETALGGSAVALSILMTSSHERSLWMGTALLGLSIGPIFPTLFAVAEQRLKLSGQITSFFLVGAGLGAMFIPWLMGVAMRRFGAAVLLPSVGASLGLLFAFYLAMTPSLYMFSLRRR